MHQRLTIGDQIVLILAYSFWLVLMGAPTVVVELHDGNTATFRGWWC